MNLQEELSKILDQYGEAIVTAIRDSIGLSGKVASGNLQNSVQYEVNNEGLFIWANGYLKYVEDGRRANMPPPPIQAILDWIAMKGIIAEGITSRKVTNNKTGKTRVRRDQVDISQKRAAFAISRSIGQKGFPGTSIVRPVINEIQDPLMEAVSQVVANVLGDQIAQDWKQAETDKLSITIAFNQ